MASAASVTSNDCAAVRELLSKSAGRSADVRGLYLYTAREYFPHCSFVNEFSEDNRKESDSLSSSESLYSMLELQMKGRGLLEAEKNLQLRKLLSKKNMAAVMAKKKPVDMKNVDQKEADSSGSESIGIDTNKAETQTAKSGNEVYSYDVQSLAKSSKRRSRAFQVVPRAIEEDDIARESFQD